MSQDEASFGRINKPKYCWCKKGIRPSVPRHHIREYRYVYGAVEPATGESSFLIMSYTPELNPIEQIWKEIRKHGFKNEVLQTLNKVVIRLCEPIRSLSPNSIISITHRD